MNNNESIVVCFFRQDIGTDTKYDRMNDLVYRSIKFPKGSNYEGYEFFVEELSIQSNDHCKENDPYRSFNKNKRWVYFAKGHEVDIVNIETKEKKRVLSDEIKIEMKRRDYDKMNEIPYFIIKKYGNNYEEIKERFLPKYKIGDIVLFKTNDGTHEGKIWLVDTFGTFEQNYEPSYDIENEKENMIYKHIMQSKIIEKQKK